MYGYFRNSLDCCSKLKELQYRSDLFHDFFCKKHNVMFNCNVEFQKVLTLVAYHAAYADDVSSIEKFEYLADACSLRIYWNVTKK